MGTVNLFFPTIWPSWPGHLHGGSLPVVPMLWGTWLWEQPVAPVLTLHQLAGSRLGGLGGNKARGPWVGD